jgi:TP901 family phage tail tape measure protein
VADPTVKLRYESQGAAKVAAEARGVGKALDRLKDRRFTADARGGISALDRYGRSASRADGALRALSRGADRAFRLMAVGAGGAAVAVGAGFADAVRTAMRFEDTMQNVAAVSGATAKELKALKDQALDLGASTKFSAQEVAAAQVELAKAGIQVKDVLGGALQGTLALAAAGDVELAEAATYAANSMKLFGLAAGDVTQVADAFATAANTTTADVADFGAALTQGGAAAKLAGLEFRDTMVILEALAQAGVKNSDAGTSMKAALLQLLNPSIKQKALQKDLGIALFDTNGKMKDAAGLAEELRRVTDGMNTSERAKTLAILAGQDGIRTLNALYAAGPKVLREYERQLQKQGTAADVAAKKQQDFAARVEQLGGALETIKIRVGSAAIPALTRLADKALTDLVPKLETAAERIEQIWNQPGLTPEERFNQSWDAIAATGVPENVKQGIYKGLETVGTEGPKWILKGLAEAPWPAKGVIAALLLAKLAPGLRLAGSALGKALGGGLGGRVAGGVGRGAPVPVYVVNGAPGLGGPGGGTVPGSPGGARGRLGTILRGGAGVAIPGIGLGVGAGAGAGLGLGATVGLGALALAAPIGVGLAANKLFGGGPSAKEREAMKLRGRKNIEALIEGYRNGERDLQAQLAKVLGPAALTLTADRARRIVQAGEEAADRFASGVTAGGQRVKVKTAGLVNMATSELSKLAPGARSIAADTMVRMAASLEKQGRAPKGSVRKLVAALEAEFGRLPESTRKAVGLAKASFGELQRSIASVNQAAADLRRGIDAIPDGRVRGLRYQGARNAAYSTGGIIPGTYRGVDTLTARVAPGERILTPQQVGLADRGVPVDLAIAMTGGRIGGGGFASGGWVNPAPGTRIGGGPGQGTHSYSAAPNNWQSDSAYDLMGSDGTPVVAAGPGTIGAIRPFSSDPRFWGHAVYLNTNGVQLYYKHLKNVTVRSGQQVEAGQVLGHLGIGVNGGPHLHLGSTNVSALHAMVRSSSVAPKGGEGGHETPEREKAPSARQIVTRALRGAGISKGLGGMVNRFLQAGADYAGSVTGRTGGFATSTAPTLRSVAVRKSLGGDSRTVGGRTLSAEAVADEREAQALAVEKRGLQRDLRTIQGGIRTQARRRAKLLADEKRIRRVKGKGKRRAAMRQVSAALRKNRQGMEALRDAEAQVLSRLADLGDSQTALREEYAPPGADTTPASVGLVESTGTLVSNASRDDELQDRQARSEGEAAAKAEGITNPDKIAQRGELAVLERRRTEVRGLATQVKAAYDATVARQNQLRQAWADLYALLRKTPLSKVKLRGMIRDDIAKVRDELDMLDGAEVALLDQYQDLQMQAQLLDLDIGDLQTALSTTPSVDTSAGDEKAKADAALARRSAGLSEAFIRTALGPGDIGTGGRNAQEAAGGPTVVVQTLHPTDPRTLEAIARATTTAYGSQAPRLSPTVRSGL